ncbi:hypothetical protein ACS0TY_015815 [Phlomoides rotata]
MTILTLSASVHGLKPLCDAKNECNPTGLGKGVFYTGLYLIALGTGGIEPCVSSFGADQFDDSDDDDEKKDKSSFFNCRLYRNQSPGGSPLTRISQVLVASFRKFGVHVPKDKSTLYETAEEEKSAVKGRRKLEHTRELSFFDKAAVETKSDRKNGSVNGWRLSTVTQVEEVKSIIRLLPIWATGIMFSAVYSQMGTLFVLQGNSMNLHVLKSFKIPSASLSLFDTISVIFWVPV